MRDESNHLFCKPCIQSNSCCLTRRDVGRWLHWQLILQPLRSPVPSCRLSAGLRRGPMDNRCLNRVATGASVGGALGASIGVLRHQPPCMCIRMPDFRTSSGRQSVSSRQYDSPSLRAFRSRLILPVTRRRSVWHIRGVSIPGDCTPLSPVPPSPPADIPGSPSPRVNLHTGKIFPFCSSSTPVRFFLFALARMATAVVAQHPDTTQSAAQNVQRRARRFQACTRSGTSGRQPSAAQR